jgi:hypothetical protein
VKNISLPGNWIEQLFHHDIEAVLLGPRAVIGKFEAPNLRFHVKLGSRRLEGSTALPAI